MQLDSFAFLLFLFSVFIVYYMIPQRRQYVCLLIANYMFYMLLSPMGTIILALITLITYLVARVVDKRQSKLCFWIGTILCLAILLLFKFGTVIGIPLSFFAPIGIAFYTLQAIGYVVDVYKGKAKAENNLLKYATYVSFFPTVMSGPIERSDNLLKQIQKGTKFSYECVREGILLMMFGYFEKLLVANRISTMVDNAFSNYDKLTGAAVAFGVILYAFQLYADFAGYSYIVIGASKVLGFELLENFKRPYFALSIKAFWRRWHISLSTWLRDYVYIPLGGSRCGKVRKHVNLIVTFVVSGLWHGVQYIVWGVLHGLYQVIGSLTENIRANIQGFFGIKKDLYVVRLVKGIVTFVLVDFAWLFFRARSVSEACAIMECIFKRFDMQGTISEDMYLLGMTMDRFLILFLELVVLVGVDVLHGKGISIKNCLYKLHVAWRWTIYIVFLLVLLTGCIYNYGVDASTFIYAQF